MTPPVKLEPCLAAGGSGVHRTEPLVCVCVCVCVCMCVHTYGCSVYAACVHACVHTCVGSC